MNEHILKVMAWLEDKSFYSDQEMEGNYASATAAAAAGYAAYWAAEAADAAAATAAAYWVDEYFARTSEDKEKYDAEVQRRLATKTSGPTLDGQEIVIAGVKYKLSLVKE
jgi:hypothetical protein